MIPLNKKWLKNEQKLLLLFERSWKCKWNPFATTKETFKCVNEIFCFSQKRRNLNWNKMSNAAHPHETNRIYTMRTMEEVKIQFHSITHMIIINIACCFYSTRLSANEKWWIIIHMRAIYFFNWIFFFLKEKMLVLFNSKFGFVIGKFQKKNSCKISRIYIFFTQVKKELLIPKVFTNHTFY